ncbi:SNARE domain containing protein [Babesia ovis]|uniref:SNARE domain containing protein n=1 Tax=Babesia ovis TaxID=5869 RepID=A0A9W5WW46_BABOV|nr:SNARE domain containing protein [Babesia ovis]
MITGKFSPPSFGPSNLKYEKLIATNLKHIRAEILYTEHNIGDLSNRFASQRLLNTIQHKLDNVFSLISVTEGYLGEWESDIARSPGLSDASGAFEKLKGQFNREVSKAKQLAEEVKNRPQLPYSDSIEETSTMASIPGSSQIDYNFINSEKSDPDSEVQAIQHFDLVEFDSDRDSLTDSLIETRNQGIHNIRTQIEQDGGLQKLERNLKDSYENSEEIFKDVESLVTTRRRTSRKRRMWLCGISTVATSFVFYYYRFMRAVV